MNTLRGRVVLLVDDNLVETQRLIRFLRLRGASVIGPVATVEFALGVLEAEHAIDYAILGRSMHGSDTDAVADALMQRSIPFVLLSGDHETPMAARFRYIPCRVKPLELTDLVEELLSTFELPPHFAAPVGLAHRVT